MIKIGDVVGRKSYNCDVLFKVVSVSTGEKPEAELKGLSKRLWATAELDDLVVTPKERIEQEQTSVKGARDSTVDGLSRLKSVGREKALRWRGEREGYVPRYGVVLHLDGDEEYSVKAQQFYARLNVKAYCTYAPEKDQACQVPILLKAYQPDVLVLTGHDGKTKSKGKDDTLSLYQTSAFFAKAVKSARKIRPGNEDLLIVAGACQSYYQVLMDAGATFASSPGRVLIDLYDPCIVGSELALLSARDYLDPGLLVGATSMRSQGLGGLESKGKMRLSYPVEGF